MLVITHGQNRLLNLGRAISKHRQEPVVYYLALWDEVIHDANFLTAPAWLVITAAGQIVGQEPAQRRPLLPLPSTAAADATPETPAKNSTPATVGEPL